VGCRRETVPGVGIRPTELRKVSRCGGFGRSVSLRPGDLISGDGGVMVGISW
jgi:hypothetical protein